MKKRNFFILLIVLLAILFFCSETRGQNLYERVRFTVEGRGLTIGINSEKMDARKIAEVNIAAWLLLINTESQLSLAFKINANDTASIAAAGLSIDPAENWRVSALGGVKNSPHGQTAVFILRISGVGEYFDFHTEMTSAEKVCVKSYLAYPIKKWISLGIAGETLENKLALGPMIQLSSIENGIEIFGGILTSGKDESVPQKWNLNAFVGGRIYVW